MTTYKTETEREHFMCRHSVMIAKKGGQLCVYPCTLVNDDDGYIMGNSISTALQQRVMLRHHRCYACFSGGTSCSELITT